MKSVTYILLLSYLFVFTSCNEREIILSDEELPDDIFYLKNELKPYSGVCVVNFSNSDKTKEMMRFKDGILHGERISFYSNGKVKLQGSYNMGKLNGVWERYSVNGELVYKATYKDDTLMQIVNYQDSVTLKGASVHARQFIRSEHGSKYVSI
ncbi:MAG: hypothetical protein MI922_23190 [Bacteroidales bacterium]|nr:hypothetical protein [Bacteroidales bacterium]